MAELESRVFKAEIAAWRDLKDEAKIDVHQPTFSIQQQVAVVPVLGLQQEAGDGIPASSIYAAW